MWLIINRNQCTTGYFHSTKLVRVTNTKKTVTSKQNIPTCRLKIVKLFINTRWKLFQMPNNKSAIYYYNQQSTTLQYETLQYKRHKLSEALRSALEAAFQNICKLLPSGSVWACCLAATAWSYMHNNEYICQSVATFKQTYHCITHSKTQTTPLNQFHMAYPTKK